MLVARDGLTLAELAGRRRIGTGSPRRAAQLLALGLGLEVVPIRGNVDTRLRKVTAGELDAVVLAAPGWPRPDRLSSHRDRSTRCMMLPAPRAGRARGGVPRVRR